MRKHSFTIVLAAMLGSVSCAAQNYPARPITMIVPFAAGGPNDTIGRIWRSAYGVLSVSR
jgi:tripartite-type tricarboxylate transporter receptor subunit TctC